MAASGFLTDSCVGHFSLETCQTASIPLTVVCRRYNLFATNVILYTVSFVYFPHDKWCGLVINLFTLFG